MLVVILAWRGLVVNRITLSRGCFGVAAAIMAAALGNLCKFDCAIVVATHWLAARCCCIAEMCDDYKINATNTPITSSATITSVNVKSFFCIYTRHDSKTLVLRIARM